MIRKLFPLIVLAFSAWPAWGQISNPDVIYVLSAPSGACTLAPPIQVADSTGTIYTCNNGTWAAQGGGGGGTGTVTEVDTTSPITGGPITTTGTLACATCVVSSSPGAGIAHFAGSTQTVTSSAVNLTAAADVTGTLPAANVVTGTSGATIPLLNGVNTYSGASTFSAAGAASTPAIIGTGAVFTGGNGTTTFPYWLIQPSGTTAATTWSTNGTGLGMNLTGTPNFIDLHLNGTSVFTINSSGIPQATNGFIAGTTVSMGTTGTGALRMGNAAFASWSSTAAASGTQDTGIDKAAAGVVEANLGTAAGSGGSYRAASFQSAGTKFTAAGCTSITSTVGGASAGKFTIGANTCTVVITINGATGLTAANGWSCHANDQTTAAGNTGMYFSTNNATTATLTVPATAAASDVIDFNCMAY